MSTPQISLPRSLRPRSEVEASTPAPSRRTPAQVKQDEASKRAQQKSEAKQNQASLAEAARYEHEALKEQCMEDATARNPENPEAPAKKNKRLRPGNVVEPQVPASAPGPGPGELMDLEEQDDAEQPAKSEVDNDNNGIWDPETEEDASEDDGDGEIRPGKRRRLKGEARQVLYALRDHLQEDERDSGDEMSAQQSRGSPVSKTSKARKGKSKPIPSGLRANWDKARATSAKQRGSSANDHNDKIGGISNNESGEAKERANLDSHKTPACFQFAGQLDATRVLSIEPTGSVVKVRSTTSVNEFVSPSTASEIVRGCSKRTDIKSTDIPAQYSQRFKANFLPLIYRLLGGKENPWDGITEADCEAVWMEAFPKETPLTSQKGLHGVVAKVTQDKVSSLKNKLASHAIKTLKLTSFHHFPCRLVRPWLNPVFRFVSIEVNSFNPWCILRNDHVAGTSIGHLKSLSSWGTRPFHPSCEARFDDVRNRGEGSTTAPAGNFSKANWDDHKDLREGKRTLVRTTSKLIKVVGKLSDELWERIGNAAIAETRSKHVTAPILLVDRGGTKESDFELVDDKLN
ncbi:hypothetical protein BKA70DRAFT_1432606 [Coprinopsis sp. MPI-PUGE-AT-0042]|nr:hypothetical protein BKA70DRAFT_1432606 [Coprinopsis sp. MPI-PUGE-AT-0042]